MDTNKSSLPDKKYDIYRDSPLRYLGNNHDDDLQMLQPLPHAFCDLKRDCLPDDPVFSLT